MGDEWEQGPDATKGQPNQDDIDKRIEDIKRIVTKGAGEVQQRVKRVVDKASDYWQHAQTGATPRQPSNVEEQRVSLPICGVTRTGVSPRTWGRTWMSFPGVPMRCGK